MADAFDARAYSQVSRLYSHKLAKCAHFLSLKKVEMMVLTRVQVLSRLWLIEASVGDGTCASACVSPSRLLME